MPYTQEDDDNKRINEYNAENLAEAEKSHRIRQRARGELSKLTRSIMDEYPMEDDGIKRPSESVGKLVEQLQSIMMELKNEKEVVDLLGQGVEEYKINLPEWAKLKE